MPRVRSRSSPRNWKSGKRQLLAASRSPAAAVRRRAVPLDGPQSLKFPDLTGGFVPSLFFSLCGHCHKALPLWLLPGPAIQQWWSAVNGEVVSGQGCAVWHRVLCYRHHLCTWASPANTSIPIRPPCPPPVPTANPCPKGQPSAWRSESLGLSGPLFYCAPPQMGFDWARAWPGQRDAGEQMEQVHQAVGDY
ncbi:hypothetical protein SKAU_G00346590 [Synaphobranchus kaupii]|uniref:Uncharacterized protein n=1 Tax=Synaphobranchus kaupii TaxID=118154 RepID=A0A9Q1EJL8_SYNKA|nr:hypothetical protein SKAU_G00346590 [Synaphobranchus kaupii]